MFRIFAALLLALSISGCRKNTAESTGGPPGGRGGTVPVSAAQAVVKEMPIVLRAIGNVRPSATVTVKPRVGGLIATVEFEEGQNVQKGDVLYTIDPKPFEVALAQARAALAQLREQAKNAQQQAQRYSALGKSGAIPKEQLDQFQSTAKGSASAAEAAEAAVKESEIQLSYCTIRSPLNGRTGRRLVDPGNVVVANTTELVVVNQITPIDVVFALPEQSLAEVRRNMSERKLKVTATPSGEESRSVEGELTFVDNAVKPASGTIDVKANFANEDLALWPGRFVDVALTLAIEPDAIVVPAPAVQTGQNGQYVFVIKPDQTVEMRSVELARTLEQEAVIGSGLAAGETVVTDGHIRLAPGAKIEVKPPLGAEAQTARTTTSPRPPTAQNP